MWYNIPMEETTYTTENVLNALGIKEKVQQYTNKVSSLYEMFPISKSFINEKEMHSFIKNNAPQFAKDFLGIELDKFNHEAILKNKLVERLEKASWLNKNHKPRPDFIFYGKCGTIWIVECKNNVKDSIIEGITQLLLYKYFSKFPPKKTKYLLLGSVFEYIPFEIMKSVKIPLTIALLNKENKAIYG